MASVGGDSKTRIDMTPMVDLGFLLLTFFVLTTTMSNPTAMSIVVPAEEDKDAPQEDRDKVPEERVLTLLVSGEDRLYWYQGTGKAEDGIDLNLIGYSSDQLRKLVAKKQKEAINHPNLRSFKDRDLIVMIKMTDDARYKNLVDILDEMAITRQSKYMLMDITPNELAIVMDYEQDQNMESSIERSKQTIGLPEAGEDE